MACDRLRVACLRRLLLLLLVEATPAVASGRELIWLSQRTQAVASGRKTQGREGATSKGLVGGLSSALPISAGRERVEKGGSCFQSSGERETLEREPLEGRRGVRSYY